MRTLAAIALAALLTGCGPEQQQAPAAPTQQTPAAPQTTPVDPLADKPLADESFALTDEELAIDAPPAQTQVTPVTLDQAEQVRLEVYAETPGYQNADGQEVFDLMERDYAYLRVYVESDQGRPVMNVRPELDISGSSTIMLLTELNTGKATNEEGYFDFAVVGGRMGTDLVTVTVGEATTQVVLNIISLKAAGFASPDSIEGALAWSDLTKTRVEYDDTGMLAHFPPEIEQLNGQRVKMAGFILPLAPEQKQTHFLLTSNPPSCFFHIPGGPAGAAEVFTEHGVEVTWDLVVLEGRLEALQRNEQGVVYRLHDARLLDH